MLELDLKNELDKKDGFVLCLSYFSSGASLIKIKLQSNVQYIQIGILFYECKTSCQVYFFIDGQSFRPALLEQEISNIWIFICMGFDLVKQEISFGIANKIVFHYKHATSLIALHDVNNVNIWWEDHFNDIKFPEKFSLFNIHSNDRTVDKFKCGEPGDIYSWNVEAWKNSINEKNTTFTVSKESTYQTCQASFQVYALPKLRFSNSVKLCNKVNGEMYYEDPSLMELAHLEGYRNKKKWETTYPFWLPYTDEDEEGVFRNIFTNSIFENLTSYASIGQPNGGRKENCLYWSPYGLWDMSCEVTNYFSLCKIPKNEPYLTLRGLCLESQIEILYTSGNNNGKFIWKGHRFVSIQYTDRWLLNSILNNVWAESEVPYDSLLIGTNQWVIHNDQKCANAIYTANLSLRLGIIYFRVYFYSKHNL